MERKVYLIYFFGPGHRYLRRRISQPTLVFLPRESCGQRILVGCHLWGCRESDTTEATYHSCMHWRRKWQPTPVFMPGESQEQRSLVGYSPWGRTVSDTTEATQQQQQQQQQHRHLWKLNCVNFRNRF